MGLHCHWQSAIILESGMFSTSSNGFRQEFDMHFRVLHPWHPLVGLVALLLFFGCDATGTGYSGGDFDGECEDLIPSCDGDELTRCENDGRITQTCEKICEDDNTVYLGTCSYDPESGADVCWCG
jgi:hypothetical protein